MVGSTVGYAVSQRLAADRVTATVTGEVVTVDHGRDTTIGVACTARYRGPGVN